jgi:1-acyl-sn-glycerol-3-phosphate acyltransferase
LLNLVKAKQEMHHGKGMESDLIKELNEFYELIKIEGTGEDFKTPIFYKLLVKYIRIIGRSLTRVNYVGIEKIPKNGPVIIIGNHISNIDPIVKIMGIGRPVHYLAKEGHFTKEPNRTIMRATGQIETFRDTGARDALARAADVLNSGLCLGLFPEGTRSRNKEVPFLQKGKTGVARLSASFPDVPVLPMALIGTREVMKPGDNIIRFWKKININIDEPITFNQWFLDKNGGAMDSNKIKEMMKLSPADRDIKMKKIYRKFTDQVMNNLKNLGAP